MPYSGVVVVLLIFAETLQNLKCGAKVSHFFDKRLKSAKKLTIFLLFVDVFLMVC